MYTDDGEKVLQSSNHKARKHSRASGDAKKKTLHPSPGRENTESQIPSMSSGLTICLCL